MRVFAFAHCSCLLCPTRELSQQLCSACERWYRRHRCHRCVFHRVVQCELTSETSKSICLNVISRSALNSPSKYHSIVHLFWLWTFCPLLFALPFPHHVFTSPTENWIVEYGILAPYSPNGKLFHPVSLSRLLSFFAFALVCNPISSFVLWMAFYLVAAINDKKRYRRMNGKGVDIFVYFIQCLNR